MSMGVALIIAAVAIFLRGRIRDYALARADNPTRTRYSGPITVGGDVNRIQTFAKELVALQPDVILAHGTPATAALQRETRTIPIVFVTVTDPVGDGFVAGLPHPGGNITGFLTSESAITAKMFELLSEIAPGLKRVAMLFNPDTAPGGGTYYFRDFEAAARSSKVEPIAARARSDSEIELVVTSLGGEPGGGLIVMPDYFMFIHSRPIILLAARNNVPTIYPWRSTVVRDSGLLSYGPDLRDLRGTLQRRGGALSLCTCYRHYPGAASGRTASLTSPSRSSGRPAHRPFRGLLGVHSRCGLHTRAVTMRALLRRAVTLIIELERREVMFAQAGAADDEALAIIVHIHDQAGDFVGFV
jgi:hypothetical protein